VHTSAKARLSSVAIRICIRDPDQHHNVIICSLANCQPCLKISCKSVWKFWWKVASRKTDKQTTTITYPPWRRSCSQTDKHTVVKTAPRAISGRHNYLHIFHCYDKKHPPVKQETVLMERHKNVSTERQIHIKLHYNNQQLTEPTQRIAEAE